MALALASVPVCSGGSSGGSEQQRVRSPSPGGKQEQSLKCRLEGQAG